MRRLGPILLILLCVAACPVEAGRLTLDRPGEREFIRDTAGLLSPGEARQLHQRCDTLLRDEGVPLFVVTVESMAAHGGADMTIESFARTLFDQWGDSHPINHGPDWTRGILLVVSMGDRSTRIELGRTWAGTKDTAARRIMDEHLLPAFRVGNYDAGIVAGVNALDKMARGEAVPVLPTPLDVYLLWSIFAGMVILTAVSLFRSGSSGWAWAFWGVILVSVGMVLFRLATDTEPYPHNAGRRDGSLLDPSAAHGHGGGSSISGMGSMGGGGFGGSIGGGGGSFGGGGGASGSW